MFARLFSSSTAPAPLKYRIALRSEAERWTRVIRERNIRGES
jgi:hypothetical protein